jgi:hypothetical protein
LYNLGIHGKLYRVYFGPGRPPIGDPFRPVALVFEAPEELLLFCGFKFPGEEDIPLLGDVFFPGSGGV